MSANSKTYGERLDMACEMLAACDYEAAVQFCDQLRTEFPDKGESYYLLGIISEVLGDRGKAIRFMEEGFKLEPSAQEFAHALAALNAISGNLNDMNYYVKLTLVLEPSEFLADIETDTYFADLETILGRVGVPEGLVAAWIWFHQREYKKALDNCVAYLELRPDDDEAHLLTGKIYLEQGKPVKALASIRKAYELAPQQLENGRGLVLAYLELGLLEEAKELVAELLKTNLDDVGLLQLSIRIAGYGDTAMQAAAETDILRLAEKLKATTIEVPTKHVLQVAEHERLHIGVLINERAMTESIDFLDAWFQAYDNESLAIVGYQLYERPHIGHSRLKSLVDDWREAFDLDDITFKHVLCNDGIDVVLDLCGIDVGSRQEILASGLGACRIGWLQGARLPRAGTLDKVLCDDITLSVENVDVGSISLGVGQIAFCGSSITPEKKPKVVSHGAAPVFGAVLDMMTVEPSLQLWGEVLSAIPDASLVLGRVGGVEAELREHLKNHFAVCGIEGRVEFVSEALGRNGGANLLSKIDVLLDNVVVNGTISTCDALWMGIPVISLSSTDNRGINGASILTAAGCEDWIAYDTKNFVTIAEGLAGEQKALEEVRRNLRERIKASPLCNLVKFAKRMETALRQAYEAHAH